MKRFAHACLLLLLLLGSTTTFAATRARRLAAATCTGSTPCRACTNCRYCKHCAKKGGTCGVCRRRSSEPQQASWQGATERLASTRTHSH
jgi:hypothetical protein